jgi:hypothetical protein
VGIEECGDLPLNPLVVSARRPLEVEPMGFVDIATQVAT